MAKVNHTEWTVFPIGENGFHAPALPVVQCRANTYKVNGKSELAYFELMLWETSWLFFFGKLVMFVGGILHTLVIFEEYDTMKHMFPGPVDSSANRLPLLMFWSLLTIPDKKEYEAQAGRAHNMQMEENKDLSLVKGNSLQFAVESSYLFICSTVALLLRNCWRDVLRTWISEASYHMSRVGFYGEDQSEALKRRVVLSHTTCRSITRVRLTSDLPVPSAPEIFQSAMWYGIIPAWVVLCHTTWLENSKREQSMKGSFPPVVFRNQFEWRWAQRAQTTRVTVRGRAWNFDRRTTSKRNEEGHQKQTRTGRWARAYWNHSLNVIFKFLTVCHSMNQLLYRPQKHSFSRIMVVSRIQPNGPRGMAGHQPSTPPSGLTALGRRRAGIQPYRADHWVVSYIYWDVKIIKQKQTFMLFYTTTFRSGWRKWCWWSCVFSWWSLPGC